MLATKAYLGFLLHICIIESSSSSVILVQYCNVMYVTTYIAAKWYKFRVKI